MFKGGKGLIVDDVVSYWPAGIVRLITVWDNSYGYPSCLGMRLRIHRRVPSSPERIRTWDMDEGSKTIASAFKGKFTRAPWSELYMSCCVLGRACEERGEG